MMFIMPDKKHEELAKEVLKKYDKESDVIEHKGFMAKVVAVLAIAFSLFQIYTAVFGVLDAQLQRAVHLGFGLTLVYLLFPMRQVWSREKVHVVDVVLAAVCLVRLRGPVDGPERMPLLVVVIALLLVHVACLGLSMGNVPAIALDRTGRWAGTGSALLGFIQFVVGGLVSPLVGLTGEASGAAFGVVVVALGVVANALAALGVGDDDAADDGDRPADEAAARGERRSER